MRIWPRLILKSQPSTSRGCHFPRLARDPKTKQALRVSEFLQRIDNAIRQQCLLASGQKILVAVSGGVDSMVLLHALNSLAGQHRWKIAVAHFNHRLRGRASLVDERFVRQTAAKLGLPFVGGAADVQKLAAQSKFSVEMAARQLRHEFLACAARDRGVCTIALAHHADDQVELFFLRLLRGAGGGGVAGMKWRSPSPADQSVSLVRPLLDFSKVELRAYAHAQRIRFREDATNLSTDFLRNRVRQKLLPLLREQYQPGLNQAVLRLMDIVGAEAEFVNAAAMSFRSRRADLVQADSGQRKPKEPGLASSDFSELALAVQRKVLQQQLIELGFQPDFDLIERLRLVPNKAVSVGTGLFAVRDSAGEVSCRKPVASEFDRAQLSLALSGKEGRGEFGGRQFRWRVQQMRQFRLPSRVRAGGPVARSLRETFDADQVGSVIVLRHWRPGDRFQPIGLNAAVKLQDLFVNAKIPSPRRRELAMATTQSGVIFWVEGLRIGEPFKLTTATRRKLVWTFQIAGPE